MELSYVTYQWLNVKLQIRITAELFSDNRNVLFHSLKNHIFAYLQLHHWVCDICITLVWQITNISQILAQNHDICIKDGMSYSVNIILNYFWYNVWISSLSCQLYVKNFALLCMYTSYIIHNICSML